MNNGNTNLAVPNLHPDKIAKIAFDPKMANHRLHIEAAGLVSTFKLYNPLNQQYFTTTGGGGWQMPLPITTLSCLRNDLSKSVYRYDQV